MLFDIDVKDLHVKSLLILTWYQKLLGRTKIRYFIALNSNFNAREFIWFQIAVAHNSSNVPLLDLRVGETSQHLRSRKSSICAVRWCPTRRHILAMGDIEGYVSFWDVRLGNFKIWKVHLSFFPLFIFSEFYTFQMIFRIFCSTFEAHDLFYFSRAFPKLSGILLAYFPIKFSEAVAPPFAERKLRKVRLEASNSHRTAFIPWLLLRVEPFLSGTSIHGKRLPSIK